MKILLPTFLFDSKGGGGAANSVQTLARGLSAEGVETVVVTSQARFGLTLEQHGDVKIYRFFPVNLYWVGNKDSQPLWKKVLWQLADIWNPYSFSRMKWILRRENPDIVHISKFRGFSSAIWTAAQSLNIDLVQTCHDYEIMSPEGTLQTRVGRWARDGKWLIRPYQWLRTWASQPIDAATAPSHYTLQILLARGFFSNSLARVVPNSHGKTYRELDLLREQLRDQPRMKVDTLNVLYLGRLEETKGVELLCKAVVKCATHISNLRLHIAGWGSMEAILRKRYDDYPQIIFHGSVFGDDKKRILSMSDILVVPSVWPEVFGIVIVEAYAHGKPVVVAKSGGMPELVEEGKTGFIVPAGDIDALVEILVDLAKDVSAVRRMSDHCFEKATMFTVEAVTEQYLSVYHELGH